MFGLVGITAEGTDIPVVTAGTVGEDDVSCVGVGADDGSAPSWVNGFSAIREAGAADFPTEAAAASAFELGAADLSDPACAAGTENIDGFAGNGADALGPVVCTTEDTAGPADGVVAC
ncbi:hypothetical protein FACS189449_04300 [Alphaproteobacteria bacterium]|nr:hypothetical protein FACS189449_04300 [Alphaproteobacteria bacterium]